MYVHCHEPARCPLLKLVEPIECDRVCRYHLLTHIHHFLFTQRLIQQQRLNTHTIGLYMQRKVLPSIASTQSVCVCVCVCVCM